MRSPRNLSSTHQSNPRRTLNQSRTILGQSQRDLSPKKAANFTMELRCSKRRYLYSLAPKEGCLTRIWFLRKARQATPQRSKTMRRPSLRSSRHDSQAMRTLAEWRVRRVAPIVVSWPTRSVHRPLAVNSQWLMTTTRREERFLKAMARLRS